MSYLAENPSISTRDVLPFRRITTNFKANSVELKTHDTRGLQKSPSAHFFYLQIILYSNGTFPEMGFLIKTLSTRSPLQLPEIQKCPLAPRTLNF